MDVKWNEGQVTEGLIHATRSGRFRAPGIVAVTANGLAVKTIRNADETREFDASAGASYSLIPGRLPISKP